MVIYRDHAQPQIHHHVKRAADNQRLQMTLNSGVSSCPQQARYVGPTLVYYWHTVYDVGPTVDQRWADVSCLLGRVVRDGGGFVVAVLCRVVLC